MDIYLLNSEPTGLAPRYQPIALVENLTSKIWTERAFTPGEFIFKSPLILEMKTLLPEKAFVSHRQTREVMVVESHLITEDENGNPEITISGRSVDLIFQNRFVESSYGKRRRMARSYSPVNAAAVLMWNAVDNTGDPAYDVTRARQDNSDEDTDYEDGPRWPWNTKDKLPDVAISDSTTSSSGSVQSWWLREGILYPQLMKILNQADTELGIRTIRPPSAVSTTSERISVDYTLSADFGLVNKATQGNFSSLRFDIFQGIDRSHTQSDVPKVIFDVKQGHFTQTSHLFSIKNQKTGAEVMSGLDLNQDYYLPGNAALTGWDRRITAVDAGEPEIPPQPEEPPRNATQAQEDAYDEKMTKWKARRDNIIDNFINSYEKDVIRELKKARRLSIFSGDLSAEGVAKYLYKRDYNLGDIVSLRGRFSQIERAKVIGHVRTEDADGDRGYPELQTI